MIEMIRVNDRIRVTDIRHEDFDLVGTVTEIKGSFYFAVLDDTTPVKLKEGQFDKL